MRHILWKPVAQGVLVPTDRCVDRLVQPRMTTIDGDCVSVGASLVYYCRNYAAAEDACVDAGARGKSKARTPPAATEDLPLQCRLDPGMRTRAKLATVVSSCSIMILGDGTAFSSKPSEQRVPRSLDPPAR